MSKRLNFNLLILGAAVAMLMAAPRSVHAAELDSDTTDVSVTTDLYFDMSATGTANLAVSEANYNTVGEYNFINNGISVAVAVNTGWRIQAHLNQNMPTTPGSGYTLRVDDNRTQGDISGWSPTLSTTDVDLPFLGINAPVNSTYVLDWRIEGLTEADGATPLSRTVTFTIYAEGKF